LQKFLNAYLHERKNRVTEEYSDDMRRPAGGAEMQLPGATVAVVSVGGYVPTLDALDLVGLKFDHTKIAAALEVDVAEWVAETQLIDQWYATIGDNTLPEVLREELAALKLRLDASRAEPLPPEPAPT
jgi:phosphoenolpyruvate carboxykinase (GTP)